MATWLLVLIGLAIPQVTIIRGENTYDISSIYRILLFIICCIWG